MIALLLASLLCLVAPAGAAELLVVTPEGPPMPGDEAELVLVAWDPEGGEPLAVGEVRAEGAEVAELVATAPGLSRIRLRIDPDVRGAVSLTALAEDGPVRVAVPLKEPAGPALRVPPTVSGVTGVDKPVELTVEGALPPDPQALVTAASEGRVTVVGAQDGGVLLRWTPGALKEPRVASIGVFDPREPGSAPAWVSARLSARIPVTVRTEPGATMSVEVGGRLYGPVTAGADGSATVVVDVRPGEALGEAVLKDELGNSQRSSVALIRDPRPSLALLSEGGVTPGAPLPSLHMRALDALGRAWRGAPPVCTVSTGATLELVGAGPGLYRAALPDLGADPPPELRVDCALAQGLAGATVRVPVGQGLPARVEVRSWPDELTGDFPVAQVMAYIEDRRGDRLPPGGLSLQAEFGRIVEPRQDGLALRADYEGDPDHPDDVITAVWRPEAGEGWPHGLRLAVGGDGQQVAVRVQPIDRTGRPLVAESVVVQLGAEIVETRTGPAGDATLSLPTPARPEVLEVRCRGLVRQAAVFPWDLPQGRPPREDGLRATRQVRIRAGRVSKVGLKADPPVLYAGTGGTAAVQVTLLDRAGLPVLDEPVRLEVSEGRISDPVEQPDGSLLATYQPPSGMVATTVEVRVVSEAETFPVTSTQLEVLPRPVSWAPGVGVGYLTSFGRINAVHANVQIERAIPLLPERRLYGRLSLGFHRASDTYEDAVRGETLDFRTELVPVSLAALLRWERGLWAGWTGAGAVVTPYRLEVRSGSEQLVEGLGVHRPGGTAFAGGGRRIPGGELFGELRWIGIQATPTDIGYEGQVGGLAFLVGYRVIY
ncbi:MAG: hypothetical protein H6739_04985 [Alphaproteobacteria bacterium]|nr:hypothetical protein [Alphaproteobacteria bacterium]